MGNQNRLTDELAKTSASGGSFIQDGNAYFFSYGHRAPDKDAVWFLTQKLRDKYADRLKFSSDSPDRYNVTMSIPVEEAMREKSLADILMSKDTSTLDKRSESLPISPLQAILQQGTPGMPERPGDPALGQPPVAEAAPPGARKVTVSDRSKDGSEIKMTVESDKDADRRMNYLVRVFAESLEEGQDDAEGQVPAVEQPPTV